MNRVVVPELLDTDSGTPAEVADALADLENINRRFGGVHTTEVMVERVARETNSWSLSLLEVAAGSGYLPQAVRQRLRPCGLQLDVTLLDRAPSHLGRASRAVAGDAVALPFCDAAFDLVSCNLFAHHLGLPELLQFAGEALRVCRIAVLINDLVRGPLHLALAYAAVPLFRSRLTRHDGPVSVRRAYTPDEIRALLAETSAARVDIDRHYLFRMGVTAWKR